MDHINQFENYNKNIYRKIDIFENINSYFSRLYWNVKEWLITLDVIKYNPLSEDFLDVFNELYDEFEFIGSYIYDNMQFTPSNISNILIEIMNILDCWIDAANYASQYSTYVFTLRFKNVVPQIEQCIEKINYRIHKYKSQLLDIDKLSDAIHIMSNPNLYTIPEEDY